MRRHCEFVSLGDGPKADRDARVGCGRRQVVRPSGERSPGETQ
jgi:hypothetical protein